MPCLAAPAAAMEAASRPTMAVLWLMADSDLTAMADAIARSFSWLCLSESGDWV